MSSATLTLHAPKGAAEPEPAAPRARGRSRWRWVAAGLLLAALGAWFAPAVVGRGPLRHRLVHVVFPEYPGGATIGGARLGWLEPVTLRDVALTDLSGNAWLRIGEVKTSRSLAGLLTSSRDLGTITVVRPDAAIRVRTDGSNLEDVLTPFLRGESSTAGLRLVVEQGRVGWSREDRESKATVENLAVVFERAAGAGGVARLEVDGRMTDGETGGDVSAGLVPAAGDAPPVLSLAATDVPLGVAQPWLDRFGVGVAVSGRGSADLVGSLGPDGGLPSAVEGSLEGRKLWLTVPAVTDGETIQINSLTLAVKAATAGDSLAVERLELRSELGTVAVSGQVPMSIGSLGWETGAASVLNRDLTVTGSLDLAAAAAAVGRVVGLRDPVESGRLDFEMRTAGPAGERTGTLLVRSTDLVAGATPRRFVWKEPLSADATVRRDGERVVVERLGLRGAGVTLTGSGDRRSCGVDFEIDLDKLRGPLAQLLELPEGSIAGRASGRFSAERVGPEGAGRMRFDATANVRGLDLAVAGRRWAERDLSLTANADAVLSEGRLDGIESGRVRLRSVEADELTATLLAAGDGERDRPRPIDVTLTGDLARWTSRAAAWSAPVLPQGWTAGGTIDARASVLHSPAATRVSGLAAEVRNLRLGLPDRTLDEPYVRLTGAGGWNAAANRVEIASATLTSETASAKATGVGWPVSGVGAASGQVSFRGGAGRIGRYVLPARPPLWLSGVVGGNVKLASEGPVVSADGRLTFEKPVLSRPVAGEGGRGNWQPVWSDDAATLTLVGKHDRAKDAVEIEGVRWESTGLAIGAAGSIGELYSVARADLSGAIDCDWSALAARFAAEPPEGIKALGRSNRPFEVRGPLRAPEVISPELAARLALGWESLEAFEVAVGPGELPLSLENREVKVGPVDWPVAGGRVRGGAALALGGGLVVTATPGRVAEDLHLTPALCRTWLRFAAPSLADATEVEGVASLDLAAARTPLLQPAATEASGRLVIQRAEATPGPLTRSIVDIVRQVQVVAGRDATQGSDLRLIVPGQEVNVTVSGGRVSHDRLVVRLASEEGVAVATSGSVGFDETLDLVAEVPLDPKWFKSEKVAAALGGQTLRIPIRGTLGRPAPDGRAVQDFVRRAAAGAVSGLIDDRLDREIGDPLRKLLDRGKKAE